MNKSPRCPSTICVFCVINELPAGKWQQQHRLLRRKTHQHPLTISSLAGTTGCYLARRKTHAAIRSPASTLTSAFPQRLEEKTATSSELSFLTCGWSPTCRAPIDHKRFFARVTRAKMRKRRHINILTGATSRVVHHKDDTSADRLATNSRKSHGHRALNWHRISGILCGIGGGEFISGAR